MKEQNYLMVDLGLPSGIKWADRNVGAETPQDSGLYFSWGNVDGHAVDESGNVADDYSFDPNTYSTTFGGQYTGSTLDAEHDAAKVNMGDGWRMPTKDETLELVQNTDQYYIDLEGRILNKQGFVIDKSGNTTEEKIGLSYSKKSRSICFVKKGEKFIYNYNVDVDQRNFIEFPFAGRCNGSLLGFDGFGGYVWSSSVNENYEEYVLGLVFDNYGDIYGGVGYGRYSGQSVRGVIF